MPPSSQAGRNSQSNRNGSIRDFFKPYTIPKKRIPSNDVVEDEIVVASSRASSETSSLSSIDTVRRDKRAREPSELRTPTKSRASPTKARNNGGAEDTQFHVSTPGSQRRSLVAVEIPSSPRLPMSNPPVDSKMEQQSKQHSTNSFSFSSTSSLSSVPFSSQASASRRIVKDGVPLVTNSSSGSSEDSDEELGDIVVQPRKKLRLTPPPGANKESAIEIPSTVKPTRQSTRISGGLSDAKTATFKLPLPTKPASMSSLEKLVREKEKREKADASIREAEERFEAQQKQREAQRRHETNVDSGLRALIAEDGDDADRMMLALERTEALQEEEKFFYFCGVRGDVAEEPLASDITTFKPWQGQKYERLKRMVLDGRARERACLSGFLAQLAEKNTPLPPQLMNWMFRRLAVETREDLCEAYVEVLRQYLQRTNVSREGFTSLQRVYHTIDLKSDDDEMDTSSENQEEQTSAPPGLKHVVQVVQHACSQPSSPIPWDSLMELAVANTDDNVRKNAGLRCQFQESMAGMIERTTEFDLPDDMSLASLGVSLTLRCHAVVSLPAFTETCHEFRRTVALHILALRSSMKERSLQHHLHRPQDNSWADDILARMKRGPEWNINEKTDYLEFKALIGLLDIALDAGFPDAPTGELSALHSGKMSQKREPAPTEEKFDAQIDAFLKILRSMSSRIRNPGTNYLERTEAKSEIERVVVRLEHCVRTRPRPKKSIFDGERKQRGFMSGFLERMGAGAASGASEKDKVGPDSRADDHDNEAGLGAEEEGDGRLHTFNVVA